MKRAIAIAALVAVAACAPPADDGSDSSENAATESKDDYAFQLPSPGDEMVRIDAVGVPLISTVLMNRDRTPSGEDNKNQYQIDTPDVQNNPRTLIGFLHFLRALHGYWHDSLADLGFEPCSKKALGVVLASPCTLQKLRFDEDPDKRGPRVIDAVLPDYITLDFDEPNRFPNGRTPWDSVSDKVFALGFLAMGGKCPGLDRMEGVPEETKRRVPRDEDGVPICTIETFADMQLQVPTNDRPYEKTFPYLAAPWFYAREPQGKPWYWPSSPRKEQPE